MKNTRQIALGGMLSAAAVVVMCLGTLIPVNTYVCPVVCLFVTRLMLGACGRRIAWCGYGTVTLLSLLLAPDREAALVYALMGYYPLVQPVLEKIRPKWLSLVCKIVLFTASAAVCYALAAAVLGLPQEGEFQALLLATTVVLWDVCFLLVDRLLRLRFRKK